MLDVTWLPAFAKAPVVNPLHAESLISVDPNNRNWIVNGLKATSYIIQSDNQGQFNQLKIKSKIVTI